MPASSDVAIMSTLPAWKVAISRSKIRREAVSARSSPVSRYHDNKPIKSSLCTQTSQLV
jgi:hypothetical protein